MRGCKSANIRHIAKRLPNDIYLKMPYYDFINYRGCCAFVLVYFWLVIKKLSVEGK